MEVYMLTAGDYADTTIIGVFTSYSTAYSFAQENNVYNPYIYTFTLDKPIEHFERTTDTWHNT